MEIVTLNWAHICYYVIGKTRQITKRHYDRLKSFCVISKWKFIDANRARQPELILIYGRTIPGPFHNVLLRELMMVQYLRAVCLHTFYLLHYYVIGQQPQCHLEKSFIEKQSFSTIFHISFFDRNRGSESTPRDSILSIEFNSIERIGH